MPTIGKRNTNQELEILYPHELEWVHGCMPPKPGFKLWSPFDTLTYCEEMGRAEPPATVLGQQKAAAEARARAIAERIRESMRQEELLKKGAPNLPEFKQGPR